jgi:hypothetical protein
MWKPVDPEDYLFSATLPAWVCLRFAGRNWAKVQVGAKMGRVWFFPRNRRGVHSHAMQGKV